MDHSPTFEIPEHQDQSRGDTRHARNTDLHSEQRSPDARVTPTNGAAVTQEATEKAQGEQARTREVTAKLSVALQEDLFDALDLQFIGGDIMHISAFRGLLREIQQPPLPPPPGGRSHPLFRLWLELYGNPNLRRDAADPRRYSSPYNIYRIRFLLSRLCERLEANQRNADPEQRLRAIEGNREAARELREALMAYQTRILAYGRPDLGR